MHWFELFFPDNLLKGLGKEGRALLVPVLLTKWRYMAWFKITRSLAGLGRTAADKELEM